MLVNPIVTSPEPAHRSHTPTAGRQWEQLAFEPTCSEGKQPRPIACSQPTLRLCEAKLAEVIGERHSGPSLTRPRRTLTSMYSRGLGCLAPIFISLRSKMW